MGKAHFDLLGLLVQAGGFVLVLCFTVWLKKVSGMKKTWAIVVGIAAYALSLLVLVISKHPMSSTVQAISIYAIALGIGLVFD